MGGQKTSDFGQHSLKMTPNHSKGDPGNEVSKFPLLISFHCVLYYIQEWKYTNPFGKKCRKFTLDETLCATIDAHKLITIYDNYFM